MAAESEITVWYDYTCGDSFRFKSLLDMVGQTARWRTVSLKELRRSADEPSHFGSDGIESISVLALALAHAVGDQKFDEFHDELFRSFHGAETKLTPEEVLAIAANTGLDAGKFQAKPSTWLKRLAKEHREAVDRWGVFGTPTLILDGFGPLYIEMSEAPASTEAASAAWDAIKMVASSPELAEVKRV